MRLGAVVLDSNNSRELADFYQRLLGWTKECQIFEEEEWVIVKSANGEAIPLVFQEVEDYEKPKWPAAEGFQQQMIHLDFYVEANDFDDQLKHAISCGAIMSEIQLSESWKVMIDPAGHPFCIIPLPA
ncbi:MAG: hypothetical protein FWF04_02585 [Clostridiales bacterium]|nr:hypothetical protein [Clostridiales bacterium]